MSWQFYTGPKSEGDLITSEDCRELLEALEERKAFTGDKDPGLATILAGTLELHSRIVSTADDLYWFLPSTPRSDGTRERYSNSSGDYKTEQDILYQAMLGLGYSESEINALHPSITGLLVSDLRDVHYFNICREAIRLMKTQVISPQFNSSDSKVRSGIDTTWAGAKADFLDDDTSWTSNAPIHSVEADLISSTSEFTIRGAQQAYDLNLPSDVGEADIIFRTRASDFSGQSGTDWFGSNYDINDGAVAGPLTEGETKDFDSIHVVGSGIHTFKLVNSSFFDPEEIPQPGGNEKRTGYSLVARTVLGNTVRHAYFNKDFSYT